MRPTRVSSGIAIARGEAKVARSLAANAGPEQASGWPARACECVPWYMRKMLPPPSWRTATEADGRVAWIILALAALSMAVEAFAR